MTSTTTNSHIAIVKAQLEARLNWGESSVWSNYDFERLSEQIIQKTGISLSVSTLKRVLGKVNYKSEPSLTTLNVLAQFLDYADWRDFISKNPDRPVLKEARKEYAAPPVVTSPTQRRSYLFLGLLLIAAVGTFSFFFFASRPAYNPDDFRFSSKTMLTEGLPNSVVFDFDASKANRQDSVFICQSWDIRRKTWVNKSDSHHSAIYYYPGYFRAKLMIGPEIVREHDIQIKTNGWLGLVEADWGIEPLYFKQSEIVKTANSVAVDKALLDAYNLSLSPNPPPIRFYNQKDIRGIMTDNFTFETELKNDFAEGANSCQRIEVLIQAKNDILIAPLVKQGCVGDIYLAAFGHYAQSAKADLSGFGCNPTEWTKLKIVCQNRLMRFYVNNKPIYTATISNKPTEIVGLQYRFNGMGAVRNTWLKGATGKIVF